MSESHVITLKCRSRNCATSVTPVSPTTESNKRKRESAQAYSLRSAPYTAARRRGLPDIPDCAHDRLTRHRYFDRSQREEIRQHARRVIEHAAQIGRISEPGKQAQEMREAAALTDARRVQQTLIFEYAHVE